MQKVKEEFNSIHVNVVDSIGEEEEEIPFSSKTQLQQVFDICVIVIDIAYFCLSLSMIIVGSLNQTTCVNNLISVWLIVNGTFLLVYVFLKCFMKFSKHSICQCILISVFIFHFVWLICGYAWIYSVNKSNVPIDHFMCYNFAYWMVTLMNLLQFFDFIIFIMRIFKN